ncbi:hypothetical protein BDR03DRAFT_1014395 [Suillus americanus]|nr:hypothetical protein BDR03DRAFT_1014395 [Suillus americanus]
MAHCHDDLMLDELEFHPILKILLQLLLELGELHTSTCFLTRENPGLPAPSLPGLQANIEHRQFDNTLLTYRPYRPYTSFTAFPLRKGQHSSHSLCLFTKNLLLPLTTSSSTPSGSPSIPISMSPPIPTTHSDLATITLTTSTTVFPVSTIPVHLTISDTQQGDVPMGDKHPSHVSDDDDVMEQDTVTVVPPLVTPVTPVLQPIQHPPSTSST